VLKREMKRLCRIIKSVENQDAPADGAADADAALGSTEASSASSAFDEEASGAMVVENNGAAAGEGDVPVEPERPDVLANRRRIPMGSNPHSSMHILRLGQSHI
jgi:hypothetical protein